MSKLGIFLDITGQKFGRWTAIERVVPKTTLHTLWKCRCDCGNERLVDISALRSGKSLSCGCYGLERNIEAKTRHGGASRKGYTGEYKSYLRMKQRVLSKKHPYYFNYGGRGITISQDWLDDFSNFLRDMGPRPVGCTLDRKDSNGNYTKDNCQWSDRTTQNNNSSRNVFLTYQGRTQTLSQWAKEIGVDMRLLWQRKRKGHSVEKILHRGKLSNANKYTSK